jgi:hypothetical protein
MAGERRRGPKYFPEVEIGRGRGALFGTAQAGVRTIALAPDRQTPANVAFAEGLRTVHGESQVQQWLHESVGARVGPAGAPRPHSPFASSFARRKASPSPVALLRRPGPTYDHAQVRRRGGRGGTAGMQGGKGDGGGFAQSRVDHGVEYRLEGDGSGGLQWVVRARERAVGHVFDLDGGLVRTFISYGGSASAQDTLVAESDGALGDSVRGSREEEGEEAGAVSAADVRAPAAAPAAAGSAGVTMPPLAHSLIIREEPSRPRVLPTPPPAQAKSALEEQRELAESLRESHRRELALQQARALAGSVVVTRTPEGNIETRSYETEEVRSGGSRSDRLEASRLSNISAQSPTLVPFPSQRFQAVRVTAVAAAKSFGSVADASDFLAATQSPPPHAPPDGDRPLPLRIHPPHLLAARHDARRLPFAHHRPASTTTAPPLVSPQPVAKPARRG